MIYASYDEMIADMVKKGAEFVTHQGSYFHGGFFKTNSKFPNMWAIAHCSINDDYQTWNVTDWDEDFIFFKKEFNPAIGIDKGIFSMENAAGWWHEKTDDYLSKNLLKRMYKNG